MAGKEVDYTGVVFGKLTVHSLVGRVMYGRNKIKVWLCVCECGQTKKCAQDALTKKHIAACDICRRGPCVICGQRITNSNYGIKRNTCSSECAGAQRRKRDKLNYKKVVAANPNHNKIAYAKKQARKSTKD